MKEDSERSAGSQTSQSAATDFLSSLVNRALDRAPVLQRRRPALFEPSQTLRPLDRMLLEQPFEEQAPQQDSPAETSAREPAVDSSPQAPRANAEFVPRLETEPARPALSGTQMLSETQLEREARQRPVSPALPVNHRHTAGVFEETTTPSATRAEPASTPSLPAAPLHVSETIIERQIEIHAQDSAQRFQPVVGNKLTPGDQLSPQPPVTAAAIQLINRKGDDRKMGRSSENHKSEPRTPVDSIRAVTKEPIMLVTPQTLTPRVASPVTQLQPAAERKPSTPAPVEPLITLEPRPAKQESLRPIAGRRMPPAAATRAGPQSSPVTEPTIRVTIGRVEVRATLPSSPPRVTRPSAPRLSLDDYLKSRGGGAK